MMAGRPHQSEDRLTKGESRLNRGDGAPRSAASNPKGAGVDQRIAGRKIAQAANGFRLTANQLEILRRMDSLDLFDARVAGR